MARQCEEKRRKRTIRNKGQDKAKQNKTQMQTQTRNTKK